MKIKSQYIQKKEETIRGQWAFKKSEHEQVLSYLDYVNEQTGADMSIVEMISALVNSAVNDDNHFNRWLLKKEKEDQKTNETNETNEKSKVDEKLTSNLSTKKSASDFSLSFEKDATNFT